MQSEIERILQDTLRLCDAVAPFRRRASDKRVVQCLSAIQANVEKLIDLRWL